MSSEGPARLEKILEHGNTHYPFKPAIRYLENGTYKSVSYGELQARAHRLARTLQARFNLIDVSTLYVGLFLGRSVE